MDNLFAIGIGLALRAVIDTITDHNHRVNGSLVGLWEGVVLHHFLGKFPRSYDPYIAYGLRLFMDFFVTESLTRMAITLLWTGLGMLFADLSVDMQTDRRFRRLWRNLSYSWPVYTPSKSRSTPSRVQFFQIPSTTVSSSTARSSSLRSPTTPRRSSGLRAVSFLRPSTTPLPGAFSELSEAESDASRQRILDEHQHKIQEYQRRLQEQQQQQRQQEQEQRQRQSTQQPIPVPLDSRSSSELEYVPRERDMPTIPDTPGEEFPPVRRTPTTVSSSSSAGYTQPWSRPGVPASVSSSEGYLPIRPRPSTSYVSSMRQPLSSPAAARVPSSVGSGGSAGLTTPGGTPRDVLSPISVKSGLTTPATGPFSPPAAQERLPPVTVIDEARSQPQRTLDANMTELPEPAPIPIRLRPVSDAPPTPPNLSDVPAPGTTPAVQPPMTDVPEIPTVDEVEVAAPPTGDVQGPPPPYDQADQHAETDEVPDDKSDITGVESVISGVSKNAIVARADTLRKQAEEEEATRKKLDQAYREARQNGEYWKALRLKVEMDQVGDHARQLHAQAARRYFKAHNLTPQNHEVDVHRLKVPEAIAKTERALYDAMIAGAPLLRIITGRGNHSKGKIPVLKLAIIGVMQDHHIEATPDPNNPGILIIAPPAKV